MAGTGVKMLTTLVLFAISGGLVWTGWNQYKDLGGTSGLLTMGLGALIFLIMIYGFAKMSE